MGAARLVSDEVVLDMSLHCFAESGFEGTSVRDICRRLEVSHNILHERYGSKERLWRAAVDHGFKTLALELAEAARDAPDDALERLRAILVRYVEVTGRRPALIRIINTEAAQAGPHLDYIFERYLGPAHQVADATLRLLETQGRARWVPAATLHFLVGHGAGGLASLPALAGKFDPSDPDPGDQALRAVDLILNGILC